MGPKGASGIQLTPDRSLAIDQQIYSFGLPVFVASPSCDILNEGKLFARLMICQDMGSAIVGLARGDIFVGSGNDAGKYAGNIAHKTSFYIFAPKA